MLKIKDNVDLKELEKFGFVYNKEYNWYEYRSLEDKDEYLVVLTYKNEEKNITIYIDTEYWKCYCNASVFNVLYDLIQAGLVEKVGERDGIDI